MKPEIIGDNHFLVSQKSPFYLKSNQIVLIETSGILSRKLLTDAESVYDDGFLRVEHDNYYVACAGENIKLPRAEFLIVSRLVRTPERFVASEDLWKYAWNERKPFNAVSLHVYMYRLRKKFEPFGIQIETMVNVGYRIVQINEKSSSAQ